jgi:hypothetical protein
MISVPQGERVSLQTYQAMGYPSNDTKQTLLISGIGSASCMCPCLGCEQKKKRNSTLQRRKRFAERMLHGEPATTATKPTMSAGRRIQDMAYIKSVRFRQQAFHIVRCCSYLSKRRHTPRCMPHKVSLHTQMMKL